jgi:hypothetical protein
MPENEEGQAAAEDAARHATAAEGAASTAEAKQFPAEYVRALRDEAAEWRIKAQQASAPWTGVTDDDQKVWQEMIRLTQSDKKAAAAYMKTVAEYLDGPAPAAEGAPAPQITERDIARMVDERVAATTQQGLIHEIEKEAAALGYKPGTREYVNLLWTAEHETEADLQAAHKKLQAEQDERLREALEAREAERRGWPLVPRGGAAPGSEPKQPKTFEEAKASMMARLDRM